MSIYLIIILLIVVLDFSWTQYLAYRNRKRMSPNIPMQLAGIYNEEEYARQQAYQKENSLFGLYTSIFSFVVLLGVLSLGIFGWLDEYLRQYISNEIILTLVFFGVIYLINDIITLPFSYYATFVIEERFGFNKSTKTIFWVDQIKELLITFILGGGILALVVWLYNTLGEYAWLYAWAAVTAVSLFMTLFYSNLIVPLFNKQTPLEQGELRDAIETFANKAGFAINNIYVMDASKRSSKGNAYFTGFGAKKRIVLFDTLINDLDTQEIVAVLAHEIGHYKKKHTLQGMFTSVCYTGIILFLLSLFLGNQDIAIALGAKEASFHLGMIAFSVLLLPFHLLLVYFPACSVAKTSIRPMHMLLVSGFPNRLFRDLRKCMSNRYPISIPILCMSFFITHIQLCYNEYRL